MSLFIGFIKSNSQNTSYAVPNFKKQKQLQKKIKNKIKQKYYIMTRTTRTILVRGTFIFFGARVRIGCPQYSSQVSEKSTHRVSCRSALVLLNASALIRCKSPRSNHVSLVGAFSFQRIKYVWVSPDLVALISSSRFLSTLPFILGWLSESGGHERLSEKSLGKAYQLVGCSVKIKILIIIGPKAISLVLMITNHM